MTLRVLSLGAGVQSSTVLLMACEGELPGLDAAIFADTGWEPDEVYGWLEHELLPRAQAAEIPVYVVRRYDDGRDIRSTPWAMPLFVRSLDGEPGMIGRQCTADYKIAPIRRQMRALIDGPPTPGAIEQWLGISFDEVGRMRDSNVAYIVNRYPLVDRRLDRAACNAWLARRGLKAPRSACIGCPFHSDAEWLAIKGDPAAWASAVEVDESLRTADREKARPGARRDFDGDAFLHRDRIPLVDVSLANENQLALFGEECAGVCGV